MLNEIIVEDQHSFLIPSLFLPPLEPLRCTPSSLKNPLRLSCTSDLILSVPPFIVTVSLDPFNDSSVRGTSSCHDCPVEPVISQV